MKAFLLALLMMLAVNAKAQTYAGPENVGYGFAGMWYADNGAQSQGFDVTYFIRDGAKNMIVSWYTYDANGTQKNWYVAQGIITSNTAHMEFYDVNPLQPFNGHTTTPGNAVYRGTMDWTLVDCNTARISWHFYNVLPNGLGPTDDVTDLHLIRLTPGQAINGYSLCATPLSQFDSSNSDQAYNDLLNDYNTLYASYNDLNNDYNSLYDSYDQCESDLAYDDNYINQLLGEIDDLNDEVSYAYSDGYDDGYSDGYYDGYNDGYSDGSSGGDYYSGYNDGYSDGYSDGYWDGENSCFANPKAPAKSLADIKKILESKPKKQPANAPKKVARKDAKGVHKDASKIPVKSNAKATALVQKIKAQLQALKKGHQPKKTFPQAHETRAKNTFGAAQCRK